MKICCDAVGEVYGGEGGRWGGGGDGGEGEYACRVWIGEAGGTIVNKHEELKRGTIILTVDY